MLPVALCVFALSVCWGADPSEGIAVDVTNDPGNKSGAIRREWIGKDLRDIAAGTDITKIIFTKICGANGSLEHYFVPRIQEWFNGKTKLQGSPGKPEIKSSEVFLILPSGEQVLWGIEAVLVLKDGRHLKISWSGKWGCITSPEGSAYFLTP